MIHSKEEYVFCRILAEAFEDGFVVEDEYRLLEIIENRFGLSKAFHKDAYRMIRQNGLLYIDQDQLAPFVDPIDCVRARTLYTTVIIEAMADCEITQNEWRILNILAIVLQLSPDDIRAVIQELEDIHVPSEILDEYRVWYEATAGTGLGQAPPETEKPLIHTRDQYAYYWVLKTALDDRVITSEEGNMLLALEEVYGLKHEYRNHILDLLREGGYRTLDQRYLAQFTQQLDPIYERDVYYRVLKTVIEDASITEDQWAILNILRSLYHVDLETHRYIEQRIRSDLHRLKDPATTARFEHFVAAHNTDPGNPR